MVGIDQQDEGKLVFGNEPLMRGRAVATHPDHHEPLLQQLRIPVAERAGFGRTAGGIVFRVKIKNDPLPLTQQVGQRDRISVLVQRLKCGRLISCF